MTEPTIAEQIAAVKRAAWCYEEGAAASPYTSHIPVALHEAAATLEAIPAMLAVIEAARALCREVPRGATGIPGTRLADALAALPPAPDETP